MVNFLDWGKKSFEHDLFGVCVLLCGKKDETRHYENCMSLGENVQYHNLPNLGNFLGQGVITFCLQGSVC